MDIRYKLNRVREWRPYVGFSQAVLFELKWAARVRDIRVRVPGYPSPFFIRRGESDITVFESVFVRRELDILLPPRPKLIVDGGANIGLTAAYYANKYPGSKIVAIEPDAKNCSMIERNCAPFTNISLIRAGLWSHPARLKISNPSAGAWAFQCEEAAPDDPDSFSAVCIGDIIADSGLERCDLLKLDVEGAEEVLFSTGAEEWLPKTDAILVEVHSEEAERAIRKACSEREFAYHQIAEKILITRKQSATGQTAIV